MSFTDWGYSAIEIPEIFYSGKTKQPFSCCSRCGHIFDYADAYVVEKAYKKNMVSGKHELIFEYAICANCQESIRTEISKESLQNIDMYYKLYVDFEKRNEELLLNGTHNIDEWISNCIFTGNSIKDEEEYTIGAFIMNNELILKNLPMAIGAKAMMEMQEILSKKTKDFLDGFQKEIFPPDVREKIPDGSLIIL